MQLRPLLPHQHRAFEYAAKRSRVALFMEMRLGKTAVAIRWARHHKLDRILVLGPTSVLPGWIDELMIENVRPADIHYLSGSTAVRLLVASEIDTGWAVTNYETVRMQPSILDMHWDGIVLDESTRIRNPKAQITKLLLRKASRIPHRAILSGLPAPESALDYWCQMAFLHGDFCGTYNYWAFRSIYFKQDWTGYGWMPKTETLHKVKKEVHSKAFVLTRKSAGIGSRKVYEKRVVEIDREQQRLYRIVSRDYAFREGLETKWATVRQLWLARIAGGFSPDPDDPVQLSRAKQDEIISLLEGELHGEPLVIWFRFNQELRTVAAALQAKKYRVRTLTGADPVGKRKEIRDDFQSGKFDVLCIQLKIGRYGIDLSRASTAIYYSNSYDYEDRAQSEDRIIHPAKQEPVLYLDLITRTTVDLAVVHTLREKGITARSFMSRLLDNMRRDYYLNYGYKHLGTPMPAFSGEAMSARVRRLFPGSRKADRILDRRK